jgi:hypothetical protein
VGTNVFPRSRGPVEMISPAFDAPFKNARWELFLPPDYDYDDFAGTMTREPGGAPQVADFSVLEYNRAEMEDKSVLRRELSWELSAAKQQLSKGNVKEAWGNYHKAKARGGEAKDEDFKQLEEDLRRAQSSNLINAQQSFSLANNQPAAQQAGKSVAGAGAVRYDTAAAEAQWTKLQQAQEVETAKVCPLRVNLPTRGLRHVFTQVLQTEIGKPMTIRLQAANAKSVSWPRRLATGAAAFLALWGVVGAVASRAGRRTA